MNTYYVSDINFKNSDLYQDFISENPGKGNLKIRAYAANQAVPVSNVKITISKIIDSDNVIFFEGYTNESGVIEKISLPTPVTNSNDLSIPNKITYSLHAFKNNLNLVYEISMYNNVCVVQNINVIPTMGDI